MPLDRAVADWMAAQRWFAAKSRRIASVRVEDRLRVADATLSIVRVELEGGAVDRYVLALGRGPGIADAFDDPAFCRALLGIVPGGVLRGERGSLVGRPSPGVAADLPPEVAVHRLHGEQSNTSVAFGDRLILKHFRRLGEGVNPELEITRHLTEHTGFRNAPRLAGALEYVDGDGSAATLAVVHELVARARDGWQWLLARLAAGEDTLPALRRLGRRTAELHLALAGPTADPAFAAEPIDRADVAAWTQAIARQVDAARQAAAPRALPDVPDAAGRALAGLLGAAKIRHHGDFHLGQTLAVNDGEDFVIIDFEGEPLRPVAERRRKHTPLRDVAGMLRSLAYAAATMARSGRDVGRWEAEGRAAFMEAYRTAAHGGAFLPSAPDALTRAIAALELEKAAYEIVYEANNRPDWIEIPLGGFVSATASLARAAGAA